MKTTQLFKILLSAICLLLTKSPLLAQNYWLNGHSATIENNIAEMATNTANGDIYITGYFKGTLTIGSKTLVSKGGFDPYAACYSATGQVKWAFSGGSSQDDFSSAIAFDGDNAVYFVGSFQGTANFGGKTITSVGNYDVFTIKLTASTGAYEWWFRGGGSQTDVAIGCTAGTDRCMVTGMFQGSAGFIGNNYTSKGGYDGFFMNYDANGGGINAFTVGGANDDQLVGVKMNENDYYVYGNVIGSFSFLDKTMTTNSNSLDWFAMRIQRSTGNLYWYNTYGGADEDHILMGDLDEAGNLYLGGKFKGTGIFGSNTINSVGDFDAVYVKLTAASGAVSVCKNYGGTGEDVILSMNVDATGNVLLGGIFQNSITISGSTFTSMASANKFNSFILKNNAQGANTWKLHAKSPTDVNVTGVRFNQNANVSFAGYYTNNVQLIDKSLSNNSETGFVGQLNANGQFGCTLLTAPTITAEGPTTFCDGNSVKLSVPVQSGASYQWQRNGASTGSNSPFVIATLPGTYTVSVDNGCGTVAGVNSVLVSITPGPGTPIISQNGGTLSVSVQGNTYQWRDANGNNIPLAVNATYQPPQPGLYSVMVTFNGCAVESEPFNFQTTAIDNEWAVQVKAWPNPARSELRFDWGTSFSGQMVLSVFSIDGKKVASMVGGFGQSTLEISVAQWPAGLYHWKLVGNAGVAEGKVLVER